MGRRGNGIKMSWMGIRKVEGKEGKRMDAKGALREVWEGGMIRQ